MKNSSSQTDRWAGRVRVKRARRDQIQWRDASLDQLIPRDHRVRAVWAYVEAQARLGRPGPLLDD